MDNSNGLMVKELLYTAEGGFVTEVELPPFITKPEVLIWGARVFIHVDSFNPNSFGIDTPDELYFEEREAYIEAFAYYVPPRVEDLPRRDLLEMIGSTAADMPGIKTALGEPIPKPTEIAPDHYETESKWSTIKDQDPNPEQTAAGYCSHCGVKMPDHTPECPVFIHACEMAKREIGRREEAIINTAPTSGQFKGYCVLCGTPGGEHKLACPHHVKDPEPLNPEMFPGEDYPSEAGHSREYIETCPDCGGTNGEHIDPESCQYFKR